jgi:hypothetical protein
MPAMLRTWCFLLSLLVGCGLSQAEPTPIIPTPTTLRMIQTTPVPTLDRSLQSVASTPTATQELQATPCEAPESTRTQHVIEADVDYAAHTASVTQQIIYTNVGDAPLDEIVLDVEPNRFADAFALDEMMADGIPVRAFELAARRLTLMLTQPLLPNCQIRLQLRFRLSIPLVGNGIDGYTGYFGYTSRQLNLGHWLPVIAYRVEGEWITYPVNAVGEQTVADAADWDMTIRLLNAPENAKIAAPGSASDVSATSQRFVHTAARDFALSISDQFELRTLTTSGGIGVEVYTLGDTQIGTDRGTVNGADHALDIASRSVTLFSDLFSPYPYERLVVVQGDFPDGMEFSGLIFVGNSWFVNWTGNAQSYLTIITAHEVAHQWWYARVGSDQAMTPWLDEALATYSEYIFYEDYDPSLRDWWWQNRVYAYVPAGFTDIESVGTSVYRFDNVRAYINAVYLRGAQMLGQLREDLGTDDFFAWLSAYAQAGADRVVTPDDLWMLLTPQQVELTNATRLAYLGDR